MNREALQDFILAEMKRREMSQNEFAEWVGVASSTMSRIMNPNNEQKIYYDFVESLCRKTHTPIEVLAALISPDISRIDPQAMLIALEVSRLTPSEREFALRLLRGSDEKE